MTPMLILLTGCLGAFQIAQVGTDEFIAFDSASWTVNSEYGLAKSARAHCKKQGKPRMEVVSFSFDSHKFYRPYSKAELRFRCGNY